MKELKVKVGDEVLYRRSSFRGKYESIVTVKKVTPTGRIRIDGIDAQFDKYGREMGRDAWSGEAYLSVLTNEDRKRVEENIVISKALKLAKILSKETLSYDKAVKIIEILEDRSEMW